MQKYIYTDIDIHTHKYIHFYQMMECFSFILKFATDQFSIESFSPLFRFSNLTHALKAVVIPGFQKLLTIMLLLQGNKGAHHLVIRCLTVLTYLSCLPIFPRHRNCKAYSDFSSAKSWLTLLCFPFVQTNTQKLNILRSLSNQQTGKPGQFYRLRIYCHPKVATGNSYNFAEDHEIPWVVYTQVPLFYTFISRNTTCFWPDRNIQRF